MYIEFTAKTGQVIRSADFDPPEHIPDVGDIYVARKPFVTAGGVAYKKGDQIQIVCRTQNAPWNRITSIGNLYVIGKDQKITVWSNVELAITEGWIKLKA